MVYCPRREEKIENLEERMEYGIITDPSINLSLIIAAAACFMAGTVILVLRSWYIDVDQERNGEGDLAFLAAAFAILFYFAAVITLIVGLVSGMSQEVLSSNHASENAYYRVVEAKLVYTTKYYLDANEERVDDGNGNWLLSPVKPDHFQLTLEGRPNKNVPAEVRSVRWIRIPYYKVAQNYKYEPLMPRIGEEVELDVPDFIPRYAIKYADNFWLFTNTLPEAK